MTDEAIIWQDAGEDVTAAPKLVHIFRALVEPVLAPDDGVRDLLEHVEPEGVCIQEGIQCLAGNVANLGAGQEQLHVQLDAAQSGSAVTPLDPPMTPRVDAVEAAWDVLDSLVRGVIKNARVDAARQDAAVTALAEGRAHIEGRVTEWRVIEDRPAEPASVAAHEPNSPVILASHDLGRDFAALFSMPKPSWAILSPEANASIKSFAAAYSPELRAQMTALAKASEPFRSVFALDFHAPVVALGARLASIAATAAAVWSPERLRAANDAVSPKPAA
jgi:hypothetical protein